MDANTHTAPRRIALTAPRPPSLYIPSLRTDGFRLAFVLLSSGLYLSSEKPVGYPMILKEKGITNVVTVRLLKYMQVPGSPSGYIIGCWLKTRHGGRSTPSRLFHPPATPSKSAWP